MKRNIRRYPFKRFSIPNYIPPLERLKDEVLATLKEEEIESEMKRPDGGQNGQAQEKAKLLAEKKEEVEKLTREYNEMKKEVKKRVKERKKELRELNKRVKDQLALRTWKYFEDNLREEYNYLIPDNYQENREERLDMRTSPTAIGFSLTATICAEELGFIDKEKAVDLLEKILKSVDSLEKWHGHIYNWYDIRTKKVLYPNRL